MYNPPAYVWAITIAGVTAIAAATCTALYGGTMRAGHLTTSEHPDLLAAAIRDIAGRHGVGTRAIAHR